MFLIWISLLAFADPSCEKIKLPRENAVWTLSALHSTVFKSCSVTLTPFKNTDIKRGYNFSDKGSFSESIKKGNEVHIYTYYVLPVQDTVTENSFSKEGSLGILNHPAGFKMQFDTKNLETPKIIGCETERKTGSADSLYIKKCPGSLVFNLGLGRTESNTLKPKLFTEVTDPSGNKCKIQNDKFLDFTRDKWESYLRPMRDIVANIKKTPGCEKVNADLLLKNSSESAKRNGAP